MYTIPQYNISVVEAAASIATAPIVGARAVLHRPSTVTILVVALSAITAYGFARLHFPGRDVLFYICLSTLMIPFQATLLPVYLMMRNFHLLNTYWAIILPPLASVFGTFLLRQFFLGFPRELEEAAIIDGATKFGVFWRVLLPNSTSALVAVAVVTFLGVWNDIF
jgi:multiple sugar transport system permease protein